MNLDNTSASYGMRDLWLVAILTAIIGFGAGGASMGYVAYRVTKAQADHDTELMLEAAKLREWASGYEAGRGGLVGKDKR